MAKKGKISREKTVVSRPPVVAVLGHVDHGKTTLLDAIRRTHVAESEAGGITQHIGAYQINFTSQPTTHNPQPIPKQITFIDTPGHVAFSRMRSRGAGVADLVVLVIALDEGVKPQTLESLKHIQEAKVPFLVALTKADLLGQNPERVKKELARYGVLVEGQGGEVVVVLVSGKTGQGIEDLLEMILLLAEMSELKGSQDNPLEGVVIESKLDSQRGPSATILVRDGSLRVGDKLVVEDKIARVKMMFDEKGEKLPLVIPSSPVVVFGFKSLPSVGAKVKKVSGELPPKESVSVGQTRLRTEAADQSKEEKRLKLILKADTVGTLEAIVGSLPPEVQVIHSEVGGVNESDVLLAETTTAWLVTFNVAISPAAKKLAETEGVKVDRFKIIYDLLKQLEEKILRLLEPTIDEEVLGRAQILAVFEIKKERIAGGQVLEGEIQKNGHFHLERKKEIIGDCRFKSLKKGKLDIEKAKKGEEFGAILSPQLDFDIGDMLVSFRKVKER